MARKIFHAEELGAFDLLFFKALDVIDRFFQKLSARHKEPG